MPYLIPCAPYTVPFRLISPGCRRSAVPCSPSRLHRLADPLCPELVRELPAGIRLWLLLKALMGSPGLIRAFLRESLPRGARWFMGISGRRLRFRA